MRARFCIGRTVIPRLRSAHVDETEDHDAIDIGTFADFMIAIKGKRCDVVIAAGILRSFGIACHCGVIAKAVPDENDISAHTIILSVCELLHVRSQAWLQWCEGSNLIKMPLEQRQQNRNISCHSFPRFHPSRLTLCSA